MKVELLYRDGSNYKKYFTADISKDLVIDEDIEMQDLGLVPEKFVPEIMGFPWNEDDHNILTVTEILPDAAYAEYTFTYNQKTAC